MTHWRNDPRLKGKFHSEYPDDIEVMIHDGDPRITQKRPEIVWVRITGLENDVFTGTVLNSPTYLESVSVNSSIKFLAVKGAEYPLMVTDKYLAERERVKIHPCSDCGFTELFDAPSDHRKAAFPETDGGIWVMSAFSCSLCGGTMMVENLDFDEDEECDSEAESGKKWWAFWKRS